MILPLLSHEIPGGLPYRSLLSSATRRFPASSAEWSAVFPSVVVPTSLWPCQDATLPMVDTIAAKNLASGNASGDEYAARTDGADPFGRLAIFLEDVASHLRSNTTDFDVGPTTDISGFFRFKSAGTPATGGRRFFVKKSTTASTAGWCTQWANASGHLELRFDTSAAADSTAIVAVNFHDGNWHDVLFAIDRTNAEIRLYTDLGNATTSISAHGATTASNATNFGIGDVNGNLNNCAQAYYSYGAMWGATALTQAAFDAITGVA